MIKPLWLLLLLLVSPDALADAQALDTVIERFRVITQAWQPIITSAVMGLFWLLVLVSFTWQSIMLWMQQKGFDEFVATLFERIFVVGFSLFLVKNAAPLAWVLLNSLQEVATRLSSGSSPLTPSNIVESGMLIFKSIWNSAGGWSPSEYIIAGLCGLIVLVALTLIAAQLTILIVGSFIVLNGGVVMMGFLGSDWTREHGMNYFTTVLGMSVQIFIMQLLVIIGNDLFFGFIQREFDGVTDYMMAVSMSIIYLALVNTVPQMASSLTTGRFNFDTSRAVTSAAGVAAATAGLGLAGAAASKQMGGAIGSKVLSSQMGKQAMDRMPEGVKQAGALAGKVGRGVDAVGNAALKAMASQSPVGRAFSQLSHQIDSGSPPKKAHQTLKASMSAPPVSSKPVAPTLKSSHQEMKAMLNRARAKHQR